MSSRARRQTGFVIAGVLAVGATMVGLALASPSFGIEVSSTGASSPASTPTGYPDRETPDVRRFQGTLQTTVGEPTTGYVVLGPGSDNNLAFDAGSKGNYVVAEVNWDSGKAGDLGAVLFVYRGTGVEYGHVSLTTDADWDHVTDVTGPPPLHLTTPIDAGARYRWDLYALPGDVIVHLDFESAASIFEDVPPTDYRVFAATDPVDPAP